MEMQLVKAIQSISSGVMDTVMYGFTVLGESIFFLLVFFILYWCYSKNFAFRYTLVYLFSAGVNQMFKGILKRPRPYMEDPTIRNIHTQMGYSFPSGHTQAYFVQFGMITTEMKKNGIRPLIYNVATYFLLALGITLMISRQYLGQHFLTDTICAAIIGVMLAYLTQKITFRKFKILDYFDYRYLSILFMAVSIILYILISRFGVFTKFSGISMITMFSGAMLGISIGYIFDYYILKYEPKDVLCSSIFKAIIGLMMIGVAFLLCNAIYEFNVINQYFLYLIVSLVGVVLVPIVLKLMFAPTKSRSVVGVVNNG